jgi:hypothetical protein
MKFDNLMAFFIHIPTKKGEILSFDGIFGESRNINCINNKFNALPITNAWQVYTRPTSSSDFLNI